MRPSRKFLFIIVFIALALGGIAAAGPGQPLSQPFDRQASTHTPVQGLPVYRTATPGPSPTPGAGKSSAGTSATPAKKPAPTYSATMLLGCVFALIVVGGIVGLILLSARGKPSGKDDGTPPAS